MDSKAAYIIGSGASLLDLSAEERQYLNHHANTLAMNKYLLFYEKVGVIPKNLFLSDRHFPAQRVFFESIDRARQLRPPPRYFANRYYKRLFHWAPTRLWWNLRERLRILLRNGYWIPLTLNYRNLDFFDSGLANDRSFCWARSLMEELYFYRGSLTTAINLASIVFPGCHIYLVGVDLNSDVAFYADEIERRHDLLDQYHEIGRNEEKHPTAVTIQGYPGIQSVMPKIVKLLRADGVQLLCCNPDSLLARLRICKYAPIVPR
ncbi:hypothetical protein ACFLT5_03395 [Chloroflexota bacterium]